MVIERNFRGRIETLIGSEVARCIRRTFPLKHLLKRQRQANRTNKQTHGAVKKPPSCKSHNLFSVELYCLSEHGLDLEA